MISKEKKAAIMKEYARTEGDTGSPEVQVAVLTARIQELTEHLQSGSAAVCRICPIRFWKIQESSTTDFLPDWVESALGASVL